MSARSDLELAVLTWVQHGAVAPGASPLSDPTVIWADQPGPRPERPLLTLKLTSAGSHYGEDEGLDGCNDDDEPIRTIVGDRTASLSVQGYGEGAVDWLDTLGISWRRESIKALLLAQGLTILDAGPVTDLTAALDGSPEPRHLREFQVGYREVDDPETLIEMAEVQVDLTTQGASEFTDDVDITL